METAVVKELGLKGERKRSKMMKDKHRKKPILYLLIFAMLFSMAGGFAFPKEVYGEEDQYPAIEGKHRKSSSTLRVESQFTGFMEEKDGKLEVSEDPNSSKIVRFDSVAQFRVNPYDLYRGYYYLRVPAKMKPFITSVESDGYGGKRTWTWDDGEKAFKVPIMALNEGLFSQTWIGSNPNYLESRIYLSEPWSTVAEAIKPVEGSSAAPLTFYSRFKNGDIISNMMNNAFIPLVGMQNQVQTDKKGNIRRDNFISKSFLDFGEDSYDEGAKTLSLEAFYHISPFTTYTTSIGNKPYLLEMKMTPQVAQFVDTITLSRVGVIGKDVVFRLDDPPKGMESFRTTGKALINIFNEPALKDKATLHDRDIFSKSLSGSYPFGLKYTFKFKDDVDLTKKIQEGLLDVEGFGTGKNRNLYFSSYMSSHGVETGAFTREGDRDGLVANTFNSGYFSFKDSDGDGVIDTYELFRTFTDPNNPDTDGDGKNDGVEYYQEKTDPNVPTPSDITDVPVNSTHFQYTTKPHRLVQVFKNGTKIGEARADENGIVKIPYNGIEKGNKIQVKIFTDEETINKGVEGPAYANPEVSPEVTVIDAATVVLEADFLVSKDNGLGKVDYRTEGIYRDRHVSSTDTGSYSARVRIQGAKSGGRYRIFVYDEYGKKIAETPLDNPIENRGLEKEKAWYHLELTEKILSGEIRPGQKLLVTAQRKGDKGEWIAETPRDLAKEVTAVGPLATPTIVCLEDDTVPYRDIRVESTSSTADRVVMRLGWLKGKDRKNLTVQDAKDTWNLIKDKPYIGFGKTSEYFTMDTVGDPSVKDLAADPATGNEYYEGTINQVPLHPSDLFPGQLLTAYVWDKETGGFSPSFRYIIPFNIKTPTPEVKFDYDSPDPADPDNKTLTTLKIKPGVKSGDQNPKKAFVEGDSIRVKLPNYNEEKVYIVGEDVEVDSDGTVTIILDKKLNPGEDVVVSATDQFCKESDEATITKKEITPPLMDPITEGDEVIKVTPQNGEIGDELILKFPGGTEKKYTKTAEGWKGEDGKILTPDGGGKISVLIPKSEKLKHQDLIFAERVDKWGNRGTGEGKVKGVSSSPEAVFGPDSQDGTTTLVIKPHEGTNFGEGDKFTITLPDGETATVTIGENAQLSVDGTVTVKLNDDALEIDTNKIIQPGESVKIKYQEKGKAPAPEITLTRKDVVNPEVDPIYAGDTKVSITPPEDPVEVGEKLVVQLPGVGEEPGPEVRLTYKEIEENGKKVKKWVDPYDEEVPMENGKLIVNIPVGYEPKKDEVVKVKRIDNSGNMGVTDVTVLEKSEMPTPTPEAKFGKETDQGNTTVDVTPGEGDTFKPGEKITVTIPNPADPENPTVVNVEVKADDPSEGPIQVDLGQKVPENTTVTVTVTGKDEDNNDLAPSEPVELTKKTLADPSIGEVKDNSTRVGVTVPEDATELTLTYPKGGGTVVVKKVGDDWKVDGEGNALTVDGNKITVPVDAEKLTAGENLTASVKDKAGNKSGDVTKEIASSALPASAKPSDPVQDGDEITSSVPAENKEGTAVLVDANGDKISAKDGRPINDANGNTSEAPIQATPDENGKITFTLPENAKEKLNGQEVSVEYTETGKAPTTSDKGLTADTVKPVKPEGSAFKGESNVKVTKPTDDTTELEVELPDGTTVTAKKDSEGKWKVGDKEVATEDEGNTLVIPLPENKTVPETGDITVTAKDDAGNTTAATITPAEQGQTPAPGEVKVVKDGDKYVVTGKAPKGSTVEIKDPTGNSYSPKKTVTVPADGEGSFTIDLPEDYKDKDTVTVTAKNDGEKESEPATAPVDKTPPGAPAVETPKTGDTEVKVTLPDNVEEGDKVKVVVKDKDGNTTFEDSVNAEDKDKKEKDVTVPELKPGDTVTVIVEDKAGNESDPVTTTTEENDADKYRGRGTAKKTEGQPVKASDLTFDPALPEGTTLEEGDKELVSADAAPGVYKGTVTAKFADGSTKEIPYEVTIGAKPAAEGIKEPENKVPVDNPEGLTREEKDKVKEEVQKVNPDVESEKIKVEDNGKVTITYPDGSVGVLEPDQTIREKTDGEKNPLNPPAKKVPVTDPSKLTDEEKREVREEVAKANPGVTPEKIGVGDDGSVTVVYPDGSTGELTSDQTVTGKTDAEKYPVKALDPKVLVEDSTNLTDEEKAAVKEAVKRQLPPEAGNVDITVGEDGSVTVTYPDGSTGKLTSNQTVLKKDVPPAPNKDALEEAVKRGQEAKGTDKYKNADKAKKDAFDKALEDAKKVLGDPKASQGEIDKAKEDLDKARRALNGSSTVHPYIPGGSGGVNYGKYTRPKDDTGTEKSQGTTDLPKDLSQYGTLKKVIKYVNGYKDGAFRPNGNITRAEAAAMFARLLTEDNIPYGIAGFPDTVKDSWYDNPIAYLVNKGYMKGYTDGNFRPNDRITRAEFAQMIAPYLRDNDSVAPFGDVKGHWAEEAINKAFGDGILKGYEDGTFRPDKEITRAEAVTIFNRVFNRMATAKNIRTLINPDKLITFSDIEGHWAYYDILEGANTRLETVSGGDWIKRVDERKNGY